MNRSHLSHWFFLASALLFAPAVAAQTADDSYAWIEPPAGKHLNADRRRELTLLRAAHVAEEGGYTHFEFMQTRDMPARGSVAADAWKLTDAYGNASNSIYPPRLTSSPLHTHGAVLVHFCNESEGGCPGLRAHRVLLNLSP
jgi:hypothetical protein